MAYVLLCATLLALVLLLIATSFSLLVLSEIIKVEEVRRWFKGKRGKDDGTTLD